jgi:ankyrin repeat protein
MTQAQALIEAVEADDAPAIGSLLSEQPKLVHAFTEWPQAHGPEAWLALHLAAARGLYDAAAALLAHGAKADARTRFAKPDHARATALHLAAAAGHLPIVRLLLAHGATLEVRDAADRSPLARAARAGHAPVVETLVESGAALDPPNVAGQTPLHETIAATDPPREAIEQVADVLIDRGANVDARCPRDPQAYTPLHRCVLMGAMRLPVARQLLAAGADPTIADPARGRTPLALAKHHTSSRLDSLQPMIELLSDAGSAKDGSIS